jgi:hypothetical protein
MSSARGESLQVVKERPDGTFEWQRAMPYGALSNPGAGGPALLADFLVAYAVSATNTTIDSFTAADVT